MINVQAQAFAEELAKIASSRAQAQLADKALGIVKRVSGLTPAQQAAYASEIGRQWKPGLLGRVGRAFEATPEAGLLTKAHRAGIGREMKGELTPEYVQQFLQKNPDLFSPQGAKRGRLQQFGASWRRGEAAPTPQLLPQPA